MANVGHLRRPSMTMLSWDGLSCPDEDEFYDTNNRLSTMVPVDLSCSSSSSSDYEDGQDYDDSRKSFSVNNSSSSASKRDAQVDHQHHYHHHHNQQQQRQTEGGQQSPQQPAATETTPTTATAAAVALPSMQNYDVWMTAPMSIQERRRQLLRGMGLNSRKDLARVTTLRALSKKFSSQEEITTIVKEENNNNYVKHSSTAAKVMNVENDDVQIKEETTTHVHVHVNDDDDEDDDDDSADETASSAGELNMNYSPMGFDTISRSRSDGDLESQTMDSKQRKEELIGTDISKQSLTRTSSSNLSPYYGTGIGGGRDGGDSSSPRPPRAPPKAKPESPHKISTSISSSNGSGGQNLAAFFLIKNLDTGNEFVVKEYDQHGMWNRVRDLSTGKHLTMEEFETSVGHSPVVKELMRRNNKSSAAASIIERRMSVKKLTAKSFRASKRRGASLLKTIKSKANSMTSSTSEHSLFPTIHEHHHHEQSSSSSSPPTTLTSPNQHGGIGGEWIKVRQQGRPYKELTALRLCQEITGAHQGSIWTIKFNINGKYLGSAGEDRVIHVWEVQECEISALMGEESVMSEIELKHSPSGKKKGKYKKSGGGGGVPDYVQMPETVFGLSEKPVCSFTGHQDDVLDLCWSNTQQLLLLSSSMDKTVRLWDLETKACLKLFAHNDYVTCIQFNPVDDDYFISGSLDAKLRIWNVTGRRVVDWDDLHEMVTAVCFSPDGQTAAVGSHKGSCRMYSTNDGKLNQISSFDIPVKKKKLAKITGLKFMPDNPSELLVTSADSRIRIYDGPDLIRKIKGFRNTSSQIAASCAPLGEHIVCASEDSNVYIWKLDQEQPPPTRHNNTIINPTTHHYHIINGGSGSGSGNAKGGSGKTSVSTRSFEHFQCKDVSVAITWPGTEKHEPPIIPIPTKRHNNKRTTTTTTIPSSPTKSEATTVTTGGQSKRFTTLLPPLPKRNHSPKTDKETIKNNTVESPRTPTTPDETTMSRSNSAGFAESSILNSTGGGGGGGSLRRGDSPSMISHSTSPSWASGWSWMDHGNGGSSEDNTMQATAWGLVIVTAGLGGEIRAYQNFGLPVRVSRHQGNLFS